MMRRPHLGGTFSVRHGSRRGIQIRSRDGQVRPVEVRTTWSGFGDAGGGGGRYQISQYHVPRTWDEAIQAFVLLMESAKKEDPVNRAFYRQKAENAAKAYRGMSIVQILRIAAGLTAPAPQTHGVAVSLRDRAGGGYGPAPSKKKPVKKPAAAKKKDGKTYTLPAAEDPAEVPEEGWLEKVRPYAGWIAGGVGGLVALALIFGGRRAQPVYAQVPVRQNPRRRRARNACS